jgi:hypothetical protein
MSNPAAGPDPLDELAALPGVAAAVAEARTAIDALRGHRVLRRYGEQVAAESVVRGATASAELAGATLATELVRQAARSGGELPQPQAAVVQGALRATAAVGGLEGTWRRAPLQALARLHALAAAGLTGPDALGRPSERGDVPARLAALAAAVTAPTRAPALVVAAVVHGELLALDAFAQGNGVVARAAERLTLAALGLDPAGVGVPEAGHAELGLEAYAAAARAYAGGGPDGVTAWLRHCSRAVVLGAREGVAVCQAIERGR